jgi:hypothetical protein
MSFGFPFDAEGGGRSDRGTTVGSVAKIKKGGFGVIGMVGACF